MVFDVGIGKPLIAATVCLIGLQLISAGTDLFVGRRLARRGL